MKNFQRHGLLATVISLGLIGLTACGGQSLTAADGNQQAPLKAASTFKNQVPSGDLASSVINSINVDGSLAARVPNEIKNQGLSIATAEGYPPMEMFDQDGKTMVGVDMSLARALGNLLGVEVKITNSDVSAMMPGVVSGRFDALLSGFNDTSERRQKVSFVDYAKSSGSFMVAKGNPHKIQGPQDLCGQTMSVLDNGYYMQMAQGFSTDCVAAGKQKISILGFANDPEALLQVKNGRAAAGMNDYPVAVYRAKEAGGVLEAIEIPGNSLFGIAIDPKNTTLVSLVQDAVNQLMANGDYDKILQAWNLEQMALPEATVNQGK